MLPLAKGMATLPELAFGIRLPPCTTASFSNFSSSRLRFVCSGITSSKSFNSLRVKKRSNSLRMKMMTTSYYVEDCVKKMFRPINRTRIRINKCSTHHKRECNSCWLIRLDAPQQNETNELDYSESMHFEGRHMTKEHVVGLVLLGHEHYEDAVEEL